MIRHVCDGAGLSGPDADLPGGRGLRLDLARLWVQRIPTIRRREAPGRGGSRGEGPAMTVVRAAVVQAAPVAFDRETTLDRVHDLAARAAGQGARLIVFPEAFVS